MKRFLSVFLVVLVLCCFSVSVFASDSEDYIMLEPNQDIYQFVLPEGVTLKSGDTICFITPLVSFVDLLDISSADALFALGIDVYVDGIKVHSFVSEKGENYFTLTSKYVGNVEFKVVSYFVQYSDCTQDVIHGPERSLILLDVEAGPNNTVVDSYPSVWSSCLTMVTSLVRTIVFYPLLLTFAVICLVGLGIGILVRVKK